MESQELKARRISWGEAGYASEHGYVGEEHLFTLSRTGTREEPLWVLRSHITSGTRDHVLRDKDRLKEIAEEDITKFIARLGVVFPDGAA